MIPRPPISTLFPYTTLFRSQSRFAGSMSDHEAGEHHARCGSRRRSNACVEPPTHARSRARSEEHTSELQSRPHLVCRLLLEKKKQRKKVTARPAAGINTDLR